MSAWVECIIIQADMHSSAMYDIPCYHTSPREKDIIRMYLAYYPVKLYIKEFCTVIYQITN